jgi:hypothetical protein
MKFLKLKLLLIAAIGFAFSGTANAQNTQNIDVTAFVPNVCGQRAEHTKHRCNGVCTERLHRRRSDNRNHDDV